MTICLYVSIANHQILYANVKYIFLFCYSCLHYYMSKIRIAKMISKIIFLKNSFHIKWDNLKVIDRCIFPTLKSKEVKLLIKKIYSYIINIIE